MYPRDQNHAARLARCADRCRAPGPSQDRCGRDTSTRAYRIAPRSRAVHDWAASRRRSRHGSFLYRPQRSRSQPTSQRLLASAATSVVIGYVAGGTKTIRVGSGGVMLPNHAPLVIAEQFGTLESMYPGRIDLGLGRAPGTDQRTAQALRRDFGRADTFPHDVMELQAYFRAAEPGQAIRAVPGAG